MNDPRGPLSDGIVNPFDTRVRVNEYTAKEIATLQARLDKQLGPEYISTRQGPGGSRVHYLAAEKVINLANEVFGFNGWSTSIQQVQVDFVDESQATGKVSVGISVIVRVTLKGGTFHEDIGYGQIENCRGKAAAFEKAKKEAVTDALKRALRNFGNVLGNCLYDKDYLQRVTKIKPKAYGRWSEERLHRHPDFIPPPQQQAQAQQQQPQQQQPIQAQQQQQQQPIQAQQPQQQQSLRQAQAPPNQQQQPQQQPQQQLQHQHIQTAGAGGVAKQNQILTDAQPAGPAQSGAPAVQPHTSGGTGSSTTPTENFDDSTLLMIDDVELDEFSAYDESLMMDNLQPLSDTDHSINVPSNTNPTRGNDNSGNQNSNSTSNVPSMGNAARGNIGSNSGNIAAPNFRAGGNSYNPQSGPPNQRTNPLSSANSASNSVRNSPQPQGARPGPHTPAPSHMNQAPVASMPDGMIGFVSGRQATSVLEQGTSASPLPPNLPAFNPTIESPSLRRTAGLSTGGSRPIKRQDIGKAEPPVQRPLPAQAPGIPAAGVTPPTTAANPVTAVPASGPTTSGPNPAVVGNAGPTAGVGAPVPFGSRSSNFVSPHTDQNRRIGMPGGGGHSGFGQNRYRSPMPVGGVKRGGGEQGARAQENNSPHGAPGPGNAGNGGP